MFVINDLPHTADIRVRIDADSREEIFAGGLHHLNKVLKENACSGEEEKWSVVQPLRLRSFDLSSLFIEFLSEVLTLSYTERVMYCKLEIGVLDQMEMECKLYGKPVGNFNEDVKAVTYHEADITCDDAGKWHTNLILDI